MKKDPDPKKNKGLYLPECEHDSCGVGFVADLYGRASRRTVADALKVLVRMDHRGASGAEENTGDGAGILTQLPHEFFAKECAKLRIRLPAPGEYAVGMLFLPVETALRKRCETVFERVAGEHDLLVLGWRDVPTDNAGLGETAKASQPFIRQVFIGKTGKITDRAHFERKLYVARRWIRFLMKSSMCRRFRRKPSFTKEC
jgi:glutamate synthase (ferredoxin)